MSNPSEEKSFFDELFTGCNLQRWREENWKGKLKHFVIALVFGLTPSLFDQSTDGWSIYTYLSGAEYTKHVKNTSYPYGETCTQISTTTTSYFNSTKPPKTFFKFHCFEQDTIYGIVTLIFIFMPGVLLAGAEITSIRKRTYNWSQRWYSIPLFLFTFPLLLIVVKVLHLLCPEMKGLSDGYTMYESQYESVPQLCAQMFMVLSRADRDASIPQIVSIVASCLMVVKPSVQNYLQDENEKTNGNIKTELARFFTHVPLFLSTTIFRVLSLVIICVLLRWNSLYFYTAIILTARLIRFVRDKLWLKNHPEDRRVKLFRHFHMECFTIIPRQGKVEALSNMLLWTIVNGVSLTILAFLANYNEPHHLHITIQTLWPFTKDSFHTWAETPLVSEIYIFNTLYILCLISGALSLILFLFQIFWDPDSDSDGDVDR